MSAALVLLAGCTEQSAPRSPTAGSQGGETTEAAPTADAWSLADARIDRIPESPAPSVSRLPRTFPSSEAVFPSLRNDPPGRALVVYHPPEEFDRGGWASETVHFFCDDRAWRTLDLADLGLPESEHPGFDTYGSGDLSPDGTQWAGRTRSGVVLVDLASAEARRVNVPGDYTTLTAWSPDGMTLSVTRRTGGSTYRTWSVDPVTLGSRPEVYRLPADGYSTDGSAVTFAKKDGQTTRTTYGRGAPRTRTLPVPYKFVRLGGAVGPRRSVFSQAREVLVLDNETAYPVARLRLGPNDSVGSPRGWFGGVSVWFAENARGLLAWDTTTGTVTTLTAADPTQEPDTYWTASVAADALP